MAVRKLHGQMQNEMRSRHAQLVLAHLVEDARAVAEKHGRRGGGIPHDVAEAAQPGEIGVDRVPVGVGSREVCPPIVMVPESSSAR